MIESRSEISKTDKKKKRFAARVSKTLRDFGTSYIRKSLLPLVSPTKVTTRESNEMLRKNITPPRPSGHGSPTGGNTPPANISDPSIGSFKTTGTGSPRLAIEDDPSRNESSFLPNQVDTSIPGYPDFLSTEFGYDVDNKTLISGPVTIGDDSRDQGAQTADSRGQDAKFTDARRLQSTSGDGDDTIDATSNQDTTQSPADITQSPDDVTTTPQPKQVSFPSGVAGSTTDPTGANQSRTSSPSMTSPSPNRGTMTSPDSNRGQDPGISHAMPTDYSSYGWDENYRRNHLQKYGIDLYFFPNQTYLPGSLDEKIYHYLWNAKGKAVDVMRNLNKILEDANLTTSSFYHDWYKTGFFDTNPDIDRQKRLHYLARMIRFYLIYVKNYTKKSPAKSTNTNPSTNDKQSDASDKRSVEHSSRSQDKKVHIAASIVANQARQSFMTHAQAIELQGTADDYFRNIKPFYKKTGSKERFEENIPEELDP